jgi:O-antigen ligase
VIDLFGPSDLLLLALGVGALGLKLWALIDAIARPTQAYVAAGKLTKVAWVAILAAAVLLGGTNVLGLFGLVGLVAAIVYLVDVRPAVRELQRGGPWA